MNNKVQRVAALGRGWKGGGEFLLCFQFFPGLPYDCCCCCYFFFSLEVVTSVAVAAKYLFLYEFFIYGFAFLPPTPLLTFLMVSSIYSCIRLHSK